MHHFLGWKLYFLYSWPYWLRMQAVAVYHLEQQGGPFLWQTQELKVMWMTSAVIHGIPGVLPKSLPGKCQLIGKCRARSLGNSLLMLMKIKNRVIQEGLRALGLGLECWGWIPTLSCQRFVCYLNFSLFEREKSSVTRWENHQFQSLTDLDLGSVLAMFVWVNSFQVWVFSLKIV